MDVALLTDELAHRLEQTAMTWSRTWLEGVAGVEFDEVAAHVLAPCHPGRPDLDFQNRVHGLTPGDADLVAPLVEWYRERGVRPWFEVVPSEGQDALLAALTAVDAVPIGFQAVVAAALPRPPRSTSTPGAADSDVEVRAVDLDDDEDVAAFRHTRTEAHQLPRAVAEEASADLRAWRHAPGATLVLATVHGRPAATAALTVDPGTGIAYLADAATVPSSRGRGLQTMLIERRLSDATAAGATVAFSQAAVSSASHRNLQRAGLRSGFTKLVLRVAGP